jgi:hypothetical protein
LITTKPEGLRLEIGPGAEEIGAYGAVLTLSRHFAFDLKTLGLTEFWELEAHIEMPGTSEGVF